MEASTPTSLTSTSHFSFPPAIPITFAPLSFASWQTIIPTPPAAPDTRTISSFLT